MSAFGDKADLLTKADVLTATTTRLSLLEAAVRTG